MKRSSTIALLCALALVLGFLETMIPLPLAIPGFKLGLANAAVLFALYRLSPKDAASVAVVKLLASTFLFGSPAMLAYSAAGTLLSLGGMILLKQLKAQAVLTSMVGAILHNLGQVLVACLFLHSLSMLWLLAPLSLAACFTGFAIGSATQATLNALQKTEKRVRPLVSLDCLSLEPGKLFALVGPESAGKTSALMQACGLDDSNPLAPAPLKGKAGLLFKDPQNQILANRIQDDIAFGLEYRGVDPIAIKAKIDESLETVRLSGWQELSTTHLTLCQQRQVALASLLALEFPVLLLDEPTADLNESDAWLMREIILDLRARGMCIVVTTQDCQLASQADSVFFVSQGTLTPQRAEVLAPKRDCEQRRSCASSSASIHSSASFHPNPHSSSSMRPSLNMHPHPNSNPNPSAGKENGQAAPNTTADFIYGLYREGESLCHRLHPSLKIILACIFIVLGFCALNPCALGILVATTALSLAISRPQPALLMKAYKPVIPLLAFIVLFDIFFSGPQLALQSALRLICVVCTSAVLMYSTSPTELCDGIERIISPGAESSMRAARFALNMQLSFRFIPVLFQEIQELTGKHDDAPTNDKQGLFKRVKVFTPLISQLFSNTVKHCSQVSTALENRVEGQETHQKTRFRSYPLLRPRA